MFVAAPRRGAVAVRRFPDDARRAQLVLRRQVLRLLTTRPRRTTRAICSIRARPARSLSEGNGLALSPPSSPPASASPGGPGCNESVANFNLYAASRSSSRRRAPCPRTWAARIFIRWQRRPYRLAVTIRPPQVIPGVAEIEIRSLAADVSQIRLAPSSMDDTRRRYYRLTNLGGRVLAAETERLAEMVRAARSTKLVRKLKPA